MDIMSMALRIQALEAENTRLHETIRDMRKFGAAFPNTMSVLKTVGFVKFLDPQTIVNLSQVHRAFKGNLPVGHVNMERSRLMLERARMTAEDYRQGGGPELGSYTTIPVFATIRAYAGFRPYARVAARVVTQELEHSLSESEGQRNSAFKTLARMWRSGSLPEAHTNDVIYLFNAAALTNEAVERIAEDNLGPMPHGMLEDSEEEETEEETHARLTEELGFRYWR